MTGRSSATRDDSGADRSVRVTVPVRLAEEAGALLMDVLGSFEEVPVEPRAPAGSAAPAPAAAPGPAERVSLVFYPPADGPSERDELLAILPEAFGEPGLLEVQTTNVSRDWVEGWREHFRPIVIGRIRVRPPWESPSGAAQAGLIDVVINPGLGFGTGLHATTRGTLRLLQEGSAAAEDEGPQGPLVDVGTGSGILAIAGAKLGWRPVVALDNDPVALISARENAEANGLQDEIDICQIDICEIDICEVDGGAAHENWFRGATVLANLTLAPVTVLLRRLARASLSPRRLAVSGILAGGQEEQLLLIAYESGFRPGRRLYEDEWVSLELLPEVVSG